MKTILPKARAILFGVLACIPTLGQSQFPSKTESLLTKVLAEYSEVPLPTNSQIAGHTLEITQQICVGTNQRLSFSSSQISQMHLKGNGVLELLPGSVLLLFGQQTLTISQLGELIIHPGARIFLWHPQAILEISGKVTLQPGASFNPMGRGMVRFSQHPAAPHPSGMFWQLDGSNTIQFSDSLGATRLSLTQDLVFPQSFQSIQFDGIQVDMAEGVVLNFDVAHVHIFQTTFAATITNRKFAGVFATFQQGFFDDILFINGIKGLQIQSYLGNVVVIENSRFWDCDTGLLSHNVSVQLESCAFSGCRVGWLGNHLVGFSGINHCDVFNNDVGAICEQGANGELQVFESVFYNNSLEGLQLNNGHAHFSCSNFSANGIAVKASNNSWLELGRYGGNVFWSNTAAIQLNNANGVRMHKGNNKFTANGVAISGSISANSPFQGFDVHQNELCSPIQVVRIANGLLVAVPTYNFSPFYIANPSCARTLLGVQPQLKQNVQESQPSRLDVPSETDKVESLLRVFPNPATTEVCFSCCSFQPEVYFISPTGARVARQPFRNANDLWCVSTADLPRGHVLLEWRVDQTAQAIPLVLQ
ncbi:MAG: hypothetical protein LAT76_01855 [Schleiferiaceae bacterium]|nr:hypothetical protein [Schleiferiaceae bacterium]